MAGFNGFAAAPKTATTEAGRADSDIKNIALERIVESELNDGMNMSEVNKLAELIRKDGLMQPLIVYPMSDGKYELVSGHCRYRAICKLKDETQDDKYNMVRCRVIAYKIEPEKRLRDWMEGNEHRELDFQAELVLYRNAKATARKMNPDFDSMSCAKQIEEVSNLLSYGGVKSGYGKTTIKNLRKLDESLTDDTKGFIFSHRMKKTALLPLTKLTAEEQDLFVIGMEAWIDARKEGKLSWEDTDDIDRVTDSDVKTMIEIVRFPEGVDKLVRRLDEAPAYEDAESGIKEISLGYAIGRENPDPIKETPPQAAVGTVLSSVPAEEGSASNNAEAIPDADVVPVAEPVPVVPKKRVRKSKEEAAIEKEYAEAEKAGITYKTWKKTVTYTDKTFSLKKIKTAEECDTIRAEIDFQIKLLSKRRRECDKLYEEITAEAEKQEESNTEE